MPEYLSPGVYVEEVDSGRGRSKVPAPRRPRSLAWLPQVRPTPGTGDQLDAVRRHLRRPRRGGTAQPAHGRRLPLARRLRLFPQRRRSMLHHPHRSSESSSNSRKVRAAPIPSQSSKAVPSLTVSPRPRPTEDITVEVAPPSGEAPPEGDLHIEDPHGAGRRRSTRTSTSASAAARTSPKPSTPPAG